MESLRILKMPHSENSTSEVFPDYGFLAGGGELGSLIRAKDWSQTTLGPAETWPQALKVAVRIMLTSRQPMFVWWGEELINLYNDAYKSIVGGKHPDALGKPAASVWPEIWDVISPVANLALFENQGTYFENLPLIMERNGYPEETHYTFSYTPIQNNEGGIGGILCANTDDTKRIIGERQLALLRELATGTAEARTVEEACHESAKCLQKNAHDLPFALIYLSDAANGRMRLAGNFGLPAKHNAALPEVTLQQASLWPLSEVMLRKQILLVPTPPETFGMLPTGGWEIPPRQAALVPIVSSAETGKTGVLIAGLNPHRLFDDDYRNFLTLVAHQIGTGIANAQAYEEERKRTEALAAIDRAKTTFFSNISHEFRTPLMLMLGPLEDALSDGDDPFTETQRERMILVQRNSLRLLKLVNSLLDFSRIEAGRVEAQFEQTNLSSLTADLASLFRSAVERAGMQLVIDCPPLSQSVYVDREMWEKIVLNLVSNAFKFTFQGAITISLREQEGRAELRVTDTGIGIPVDQVNRIFERFRRVEGAKGRTHEGTGIGLALVQELTWIQGGTVSVKSKEGQGSTFAVTIPFGTAHLSQHQICAGPSSRSTSVQAEAYIEEALRWLPDSQTFRRDIRDDGFTSFHNGSHSAPKLGRILLADDNADMRDYVRRLLEDQYEVTAVSNGRLALQSLEQQSLDLVLTDVMMPELDGFGLLREIRQNPRFTSLPVILVSARAGEEATIEGLSAGADDYLVKPFTSRELKARVSSCLKLAQLRREAFEREQLLQKQTKMAQAQVAEVLESITDAFISLDHQCHYLYMNHIAAEMVQLNPAELAGKAIWDQFPALRGTDFESAVTERIAVTFEFHHASLDRWLEFHVYPTATGLSTFIQDVTEKRRLEERLRETAKLESVGLLAGGIAHDFNNILTGIMGSASILEDALPEDPEMRDMAHTITKASERAADLTRQLLAYSGRGRFVLSSIQLSHMIQEITELIKMSLPKSATLVLDLDSHLPLIEADSAQIQQLVMNLIINGAEALGDIAGDVIVRTNASILDDEYIRTLNPIFEITPGYYVCLEVTDTGCGMDEATLAKIFDPFFTTKFTGRGLGLSAVLGIVRGHKGSLKLYSEPGQGTSFRIFLPCAERSFSIQAEMEKEILQGKGTVLVVDDEELVRRTSQIMLQKSGFRVLLAENGLAAVELFRTRSHEIDLVLLDMSMPIMSGEETMRHLLEIEPNVKVILSSGFNEADAVRRFASSGLAGFLQKPYTTARLADKIRELGLLQASA